MQIKYEWLCGRCKKRALKEIMVKIRRFMRKNPDVSYEDMEKIFGVPKMTLYENIKKTEHERGAEVYNTSN